MTDAKGMDFEARCAELDRHIGRLEAHMLTIQAKADRAAEVALGAIEAVKHQQSAAEHGAEQTRELLMALRKVISMTESMAHAALDKARA